MASNVSTDSGGISLRAAIARKILKIYVQKELSKQRLNSPTPGPDWHNEELPRFSIPLPPESLDPVPVPEGKVCIIGAGMAGLVVANGLKTIGKYDFDILEALPDRVGGRVYTQTFPDLNTPHNYYDVGAMRIPDIPSMNSLFTLITTLKLDDKKELYTYAAAKGDEPAMYNFRSGVPDDLYAANSAFQALVNPIASLTTGSITSASGDDAWDILMGWDLNSTRQWLQTLPVNTKNQKKPDGTPMSWSDTVKAETMDTSTGLFDQAFTETICDYQDFAQAKTKDWYRMDGGMHIVPDACASLIETASGNYPGVPIQLGKRVIAIAYQNGHFQVTLADGTTNSYNYVFNTTTMSCLYQMDISGLDLSEELYTGIRSLSYDRSCKVAIVFDNPWWDKYPATAKGGTSNTDLPIRTVVYPNWNDGENSKAVLIASYTWAQDASRMGALIKNSSEPVKNLSDPLIQLVLSNLAKLWSSVQDGPSLQDLQNWYCEHHAWAWSHDPEAAGGAFALFGPGQFSQVYPLFQQGACDNNFFMCGEAVSAHHAWISGAIDSAGSAMLSWLAAKDCIDALAVLKASPWAGAPGQLPDEVEEDVLRAKVQLGNSRK